MDTTIFIEFWIKFNLFETLILKSYGDRLVVCGWETDYVVYEIVHYHTQDIIGM